MSQTIMIRFEQALAIILTELRRAEDAAGDATKDAVDECPLVQAVGRVLAAPIVSSAWLPPFDNSAMDGYAVRAGAGLAAGTILKVEGVRFAGDAPITVSAAGAAWAIMTGAPLPEGLDAVVPNEQVTVLEHDAAQQPRRVRLESTARAGQHCRRRGEDVAEGQQVIAAGTALMPQHLALLAALGKPTLRVTRRPRVALIMTGQELVDSTQTLKPGAIHDSNGPFLAARATAAGASVVSQARCGDEVVDFKAALAAALAAGAEVVVSSGAVSMGRHDYIPDALRQIGAEILFHKVAIRPGKPLLCARLPGGQMVLGLPGNPVACAVGWRFFVEPVLRQMLGMAPERPWRLPLLNAVRQRPGLRTFLKGGLVENGAGRLLVRVLPGQEPFRLLPLLETDVWIELSEESGEIAAGTPVAVYGLGHLDGIRLSPESLAQAASPDATNGQP